MQIQEEASVKEAIAELQDLPSALFAKMITWLLA